MSADHPNESPPLPVDAPGRVVEDGGLRQENDWLLWQLADSAFPTGGFAHSGGLEAAWHQGELADGSDLAGFLHASLTQTGRASLPLVAAAHTAPDRLVEWDWLCDGFTTNQIANRASRLQGRAWLLSAQRIFTAQESGKRLAGCDVEAPCGHLAPVFGVVMRALGIRRDAAGRLFCFLQLRSLIASAVRLGIVGPLEGQGLQHGLGPRLDEILAESRRRTIEDLAQTAPLIDLWQGMQGRLYSRLFQS